MAFRFHHRSTPLFTLIEFIIIICVPILIGQTIWIWIMQSLQEQSNSTPSDQSLREFELIESRLKELAISDSVHDVSSVVALPELKILCVIDIPIYNESFMIPYHHVQHSWGSACHGLHYFQYMYNTTTDKLRKLSEFYQLRVAEGEFDWLVHVPPSTYLVLKNLRWVMGRYPVDVPIVFGHSSKEGLILSNGAVQHMLNDSTIKGTGMGKGTLIQYIFSGKKLDENTLRNFKVFYGPTKDPEGQSFFLENFGKTINGSIFNFKTQLRLEKNLNYGSGSAILFPNLSPEGFVAMDYLLYRLKIGNGAIRPSNNFGIQRRPKIPNIPVAPNFTLLNATTVAKAKLNYFKRQFSSYEMNEEELASNYLANQVKILCMILTGPKNHIKKAIHVKRTWGQRCNILVFLSSQYDPVLKSTPLPDTQEGREYLWKKMQKGFQFVYQHFYNEVDWFFKADDDTYAIMENLRSLLANYNSSKAQYLGLRLNGNFTHEWVTGGAGYVLSKTALKMLVEDSLTKPANSTDCPLDLLDVPEDVFTSLCLHHLNIPYIDTRDELLRQRFFQHTVKDVVNGQIPEFFYEEYQYYPIAKNINCCSTSAISFHYVEPFQMYEMEYIIYKLNLHVNNNNLLDPK